MNSAQLLTFLAQAAPAQPSMSQSLLSTVSMMAVIFVIFYFLLIRPQQKQQDAHKLMINSLKKGDRIVTTGGIHGEIFEVTERFFMLEIADKVRIKLSKEAVAGKVRADGQVEEKKE